MRPPQVPMPTRSAASVVARRVPVGDASARIVAASLLRPAVVRPQRASAVKLTLAAGLPLARGAAPPPSSRTRFPALATLAARRRAAGFTLLEVVVAVALFALVAALAYGGLDSVLSARTQLQAQASQLARLQFAVGQIERDLRAAAQRSVRDGYGQRQPMLVGGSTGFELSRHGYANALQAARAEIERAAYRRVDDRLERLRWPVLDRGPSTRPEVLELMSGLSELRLRYIARSGREFDRWPAPGLSDALPARVEVELEIEGLGRIRRLLELPQPELAQ